MSPSDLEQTDATDLDPKWVGRSRRAKWGALLRLPVGLLVLLIAALVGLWLLDRHDDRMELMARTSVAAGHWGRSLEQHFGEHSQPLLALRGEELGGHPLTPDEFMVVARTLYDRRVCQRIAWIDADDHLIAAYPPETAQAFAQELRLPAWQRALSKAHKSPSEQMDESLEAYRLVVPCVVPLFSAAGVYHGAYIETLDLQSLFQQLLYPVHSAFRTTLLDSQNHVVARGRDQDDDAGTLWVREPIHVFGQNWTLLLGPTSALRVRTEGPPLWVLGLGFPMALVMSGAVFQALYLRDRDSARRRSYLETLERLNHFSYTVSAKLGSTKMVLDGLTQAATELLGMTRAGVLRIDRAADSLEVIAYHGDYRGNVPTSYRLSDLPLLRGVVENRKYYFNGDVFAPTNAASLSNTNVKVLQAYGARSLLVIPLVVNDRLHGLMTVSSSEPRQFKPNDRRLAEILGSHASVILANSDLYEQTRRDAEANALLLRELNHRVKNNLASIVGLLSMGQPELPPPVRQWLDRAIARITTMSQAHGLFSGRIQQVDLSQLIGQIVASLSVAKPLGVSIITEVLESSIMLSTDRAVSLAMVLHEVCFNAMIHGTGERGQVTVKARRVPAQPADKDPNSAGGTCIIEVINDGPGDQVAPAPHTSSGVGLTLVAGLVGQELGGRFELNKSDDGAATAHIEFPLALREVVDTVLSRDAVAPRESGNVASTASGLLFHTIAPSTSPGHNIVDGAQGECS